MFPSIKNWFETYIYVLEENMSFVKLRLHGQCKCKFLKHC